MDEEQLPITPEEPTRIYLIYPAKGRYGPDDRVDPVGWASSPARARRLAERMAVGISGQLLPGEKYRVISLAFGAQHRGILGSELDKLPDCTEE